MPAKKRPIAVKAAPEGDGGVAAAPPATSPSPSPAKKKARGKPAPVTAATPGAIGRGEPICKGWVSMHAAGVPFVMWKCVFVSSSFSRWVEGEGRAQPLRGQCKGGLSLPLATSDAGKLTVHVLDRPLEGPGPAPGQG